MTKTVLLGFSGGLDSTAAAFILQDAGYEVHLATLDTTGNKTMLENARQAAQHMGLPWQAIDVQERFRREIADYFTAGYLHGETPAPCTRCNPVIKWEALCRTARNDGYDHMATGHYFRIHSENGTCFVRTAADPVKDQSYYLWGVPQEYLQMALTPMGERLKSDIKALYGNIVPQRESMGICFLAGRSYSDFLHERLPGIGPGEIVDSTGHIVGRHAGYVYYTIGQKRGLDTTLAEVAVIGIDAQRNRLIVGKDSALYHHTLIVRDYHVPDPGRLFDSARIRVKVRGVGRNPEGYARVIPHGKECLQIELDEPAWAAAKGQPVVFYDGEWVLGGGFLENYY